MVAALEELPAGQAAAAQRALAQLSLELVRCRRPAEAVAALFAGLGRLLPLYRASASIRRPDGSRLQFEAHWRGRQLQPVQARPAAPQRATPRRRRPWRDQAGHVYLPLVTEDGGDCGLVSLQPRRAADQAQLDLLAWASRVAAAALQRLSAESAAEQLLPPGAGESEAFYRRLLEAGTHMVWYLDADGRFAFVNPAATSLLGYRPAEMVGRRPEDFQSAEQARRDRELFDHLAEGNGLCYESEFLHKSGIPVVLGISAAPLRDQRGRWLGVAAAATDFSGFRRLERALRGGERQLRLVLELLPVSFWTTDQEMRMTSLTGTVVDLDAGQAVGRTLEELFGWGDILVRMSSQALAGHSVSREGTRNGRLVQTYIEPLRDQLGGIVGTLGITQDVTELRRSQQRLLDERERAQATLDSIGDGVVTTDLDGRITYLNPVAASLCDWPAGTARGQRLDKVLSLLDPESGRPLSGPLYGALDRQQPAASLAARLRRRDGNTIPIEYRAAPIHDRAGRLAGAVLAFHDVSATRAMEAKLAYQASHDALTGLPNRMLLLDRLNQSLVQAARHGGRIALMFVDVDRFKQINDTLGRGIGDRLLQEIGLRLQGCVRRTDTVSRQGGDEFILLLSEAGSPAELSDIAEKIVTGLAEPYELDGHELYLSVSVGISVWPDDGTDAETLIKHADIAMYHAKQNGRNTFQFYIDDMNRKAAERLYLEHSLRRALDRGELVLRYQPQVNLHTGRVVGAEALLRWRHPKRGLVPPEQFIPIAEETGVILAIGRWVLEEACRQAAAWRQQGLTSLRMAVNLSLVESRQNDLVKNVEQALARSGLPPEWLELEITESVVMSDVPSATQRLRELKELGLRMSIDDFGTGYSSLSYLKQLPVDSLKIDRIFVRDLSTSTGDAAIADAIIRMGHSLKLTTIAEGVENRMALNFLRDRRCDDVQGYLFSRPIDPDRFAELHQRYQAGVLPGSFHA